MIYLLLAIACSALFSIIMRFSEGKVRANISMLAANYLACVLMAGAYMGFGNIFTAAQGMGAAAGMGVFNGFLYPLGFALIQFNIRRNGVVLSATFMKLGLLVPMVVSICFFGEVPALFQIIGFCLAVGAILLINSEKEAGVAEFKAGLVLLLLANGGSDAMSKVFEELGNSALSDHFLFYTFFTAFLLGVCLVLYKKERPGMADIFYGLLVGVPNYLSARFLLKALEHMPAVIAYPSFSVASLVVITLAGVCFFRERLSRRQWVAVAAILVALALLNI